MRNLFIVMRAAVSEAIANRTSFVAEICVMLVNNLVWVVFWGTFFGHVGNVRGWDFDRAMVLISVVALVHGVTFGLFLGASKLGAAITEGGLDAALTSPVHPLISLIPRQVNAISVGDILFGPALFAIVTRPSIAEWALFFGAAACGVAVYLSILVMASSLTFFIGGTGEQSNFAEEIVVILSFYPTDMFGHGIRLLLSTAIPVAFVATIPVRVITAFSWSQFGILIVATVAFCAIALMVFRIGLRRYASGSRWAR